MNSENDPIKSESDPIKEEESSSAASIQGESQDSKKQILKSTGIVGGAQIITILISIVRTKIVAVLLGPAGVGISGLFTSTLDLVGNATSLGLGFSAVRDVAEAHSTGDEQRMSRTSTIMRRWMWITGLAGAALLVIFSRQLSFYTFKDYAHASDFLMLSIIPLLSAISNGQLVLLRGVRRIGDMARAGVFGAVIGFCITVPLYWIWGVKGIVPAMVMTTIANLGLSWTFARKLKIPSIKVGMRETITGGTGMIKLGFFTVISGLATSGTLYLVRIIIADKVGLNGVGQFHAAWNLSATYVGLVLGAMGADYFPRLVMVNQDDTKTCQLVNEQTEVGLLLAGPLIIGMLGFVDIVIKIFYSDQFVQSGEILLWQLAGEFLKIVSWPMGFVLLAKSKGLLYIVGELIWNILFLGLVFIFLEKTGIEMTGIAFFASYIIFVLVEFILCNQLCGFRWTARSVKLILFYIGFCGLAFLNTKYRLFPLWRVVNVALLLGAVVFSYLELRKIMDLQQLFAKVASKIGFSRKGKNSS